MRRWTQRRAGLPAGGRAGHRLPGGLADPFAAPALRAHLAGCEHCTEYLEQMRATIRLTGRLRSDDLTPAMQEEFAELYRRWRSEEQ